MCHPRIRPLLVLAAAIWGAALLALPGPAVSAEMTQCHLSYDLEGWSIVYKTSRGQGRITCKNGQSADVKIVTHGGGATLGRIRVVDGGGSFSSVEDISDLYGSYAEAMVHAGVGAAADARVMMKGNVNLSLSGTGQGINLGLAFGSFRIEPR
jgi:hypothetical protein